MTEEFFYGVTLSATHKTETWDPEAKDDSPGSPNTKLHIKLALLGPDAKPDELNVIQVETMSQMNSCGTANPIKIPIAVLKVGETRHVRLDAEFTDEPVTFELIQGSGPVHLIGQHMLVSEYEEIEEEMDEEEGEDSFKEDEEEDAKGKKAKASNNVKGKASPKKNAKK